MPQRCFKKPDEFNFVVYTGDNLDEVMNFLMLDIIDSYSPKDKSFGFHNRMVKVGDYILGSFDPKIMDEKSFNKYFGLL